MNLFTLFRPRLARALRLPDSEIRQIKRELNGGSGQEPLAALRIWLWMGGDESTGLLFLDFIYLIFIITYLLASELEQALRQIGRDDIVLSMNKTGELDRVSEGGGDGWRQPTPPKSHPQLAASASKERISGKAAPVSSETAEGQ